MKPRLDPGPLTIEDTSIWTRVIFRARMPATKLYATHGFMADRRDAELMYCIERARQWERDHPEDFVAYEGMGWVNCLVSTALTHRVGFQGSDITYFA